MFHVPVLRRGIRIIVFFCEVVAHTSQCRSIVLFFIFRLGRREENTLYFNVPAVFSARHLNYFTIFFFSQNRRKYLPPQKSWWRITKSLSYHRKMPIVIIDGAFVNSCVCTEQQPSAGQLQTEHPSSRLQRRRPDIPTIKRLSVDPEKAEAVYRACEELRVPICDHSTPAVIPAADGSSDCRQKPSTTSTTTAGKIIDDDGPNR